VVIGEVLADDIGQIASFTYTVPVSATIGVHQILAGTSDGEVAAQAPFTVTE
jgi:hypothetical protein